MLEVKTMLGIRHGYSILAALRAQRCHLRTMQAGHELACEDEFPSLLPDLQDTMKQCSSQISQTYFSGYHMRGKGSRREIPFTG